MKPTLSDLGSLLLGVGLISLLLSLVLNVKPIGEKSLELEEIKRKVDMIIAEHDGRSRGVFGSIKVQEISLVSPDRTKVIKISANDETAGIWIDDLKNHKQAAMVVNESLSGIYLTEAKSKRQVAMYSMLDYSVIGIRRFKNGMYNYRSAIMDSEGKSEVFYFSDGDMDIANMDMESLRLLWKAKKLK